MATPITFKEKLILMNYTSAAEFLRSKGLVNNTTKRQEKNGTIAIMDPITKRQFALTKAGYIRTYIPGTGYAQGLMTTYQLNPRHNYDPVAYEYGELTHRVLFPNEYKYMATLLLKTIQNIRKKS